MVSQVLRKPVPETGRQWEVQGGQLKDCHGVYSQFPPLISLSNVFCLRTG